MNTVDLLDSVSGEWDRYTDLVKTDYLAARALYTALQEHQAKEKGAVRDYVTYKLTVFEAVLRRFEISDRIDAWERLSPEEQEEQRERTRPGRTPIYAEKERQDVIDAAMKLCRTNVDLLKTRGKVSNALLDALEDKFEGTPSRSSIRRMLVDANFTEWARSEIKGVFH